MSDHITAKYLSSLSRVMVQYDLEELVVDNVKMVRRPGMPTAAAVAKKLADWASDGTKDFAETPGSKKAKRDPDAIDPEAVEADPAFQMFSGFGTAPGNR